MKFLRLLAVFLAAAPAFAQTPELDTVLDKAGGYVAAYENTFLRVVAEETYRQEVRGAGTTDAGGFAVEGTRTNGDLFEPAMGAFVPREMREKYTLKDGSKIEGRAAYANFRRYQVMVAETIK